ncbi:Calx-beta domain-containing protein [Gimesia sp.]|uniref:Calx-beta domain-containing protein n=1 Tax=Gimesia sp. TaxID=2024833 RepID=UPI003A9183E9
MRHINSHAAKTVELLEDRTLLTSLISIDDITIAEGDSGSATASITVTRTGDSAGDLNSLALVSFTTQDGTAATAEGDYIAQNGTLVFTADPTELTQTQMITVQINGDTLTEADETFQLLLTGSNSASSTISDDSGLVTISNDDSTTFSISDASAAENETLTFNVSLSEAAGVDISFRVNTQTGTADHSDYTFLSNQLVTIKAGDLSTDVTVHMHDDEIQEGNETFTVVISDPQIVEGSLSGTMTTATDSATGTIVNDDALPGSVFSIQNMIVTEKDSGVANLVLRVTRTGGSAGDLNFATTVDFTTMDGTAIAGEDYTAKTTTLSFSASATATSQYKNILISVTGDAYKELTETFVGRLSNPTGGSILKGNAATLEGTISILNDDTSLSFQNEHFADSLYANYTYDNFGDAIAMDGDVMVVGVPNNAALGDRSGAVYVYRRNQQGTPADETDDTWELETTLFSDAVVTDSYQGTEFGYSVDIEDDTIVVGSHREGGKGAAYVFTRVGTDWKTQPPLIEKFDVSGTYSTYLFGASVSISQDTIVVGARSDSSGISWGGAAYIFEKNGANWSAPVITQLLPADPLSNKYYGVSVSVEGDLIVVGALNDTHSSGTYSGSAYIYTRNGTDWNTLAPTETKITASDGSAYAYFGSSVSTNGTEIAIAARSARNGDGTGTVYLYEKNGTDWSTIAPDEIKFTNQNDGNFFGTSLLLHDDQLVVGEYGAAYVYNKGGATWDPGTVTESVLTKSTSEASNLGKAVASSGSTVAAGAPTLSLDGNNSGEVIVFQESTPGTWNISSELNQDNSDTAHNVGDEFGKIISMDDQYMLIVAPATDSALAPAGVLYVYARNDQGTASESDDTWDYETSFTAPDAANTASFADSVAIAGSTFLVSATLTSGVAEVYIYERNGTDWTTITPTVTPLLTSVGRTLNGYTAIAIEDQTIVIGNQDATGNASQSGAVYVYEQNGSDWSTLVPTETVLAASEGSTGDAFGSAVDIQGSRIIVGAPKADNRGVAYLYQQGTTGWSSASETRLTGSNLKMGDKFGTTVLIDQDTVAIAAPEYDGSTANEGAVYLYDSRNGWDNLTETFLSTTDGNSYNYFGTSIDLHNNILIVGTDRYSAYIYENLSGWDSLNVSKLYYDSTKELYNLGLGEVVALHGNSLTVANLYNEITTISSVYSYNQQTPTFSIENASITENDNGTQTLNLTVSVTDIPDGLYNQPISIDFSTADGTATTADGDYQPLAGTLYFDEDSPLATQSQTISILINGDTKVELAETFSVTLSNPSVASDLSQGTALVTINDNDTASLSISDVVVNEADGTATVTVFLNQAAPGDLTVDYATSQGTAIAGTDYSATSGNLSFVVGQQTQTITVDIYDDEIAELEDSFDIILSNLQSTGFNASLLDNTGSVTIEDNDRLHDFEFKSKFQATGTVHDGDHLGNDMAVDGDTMIVGAPFWSATIPNQGAALIYVRNRQGTHNDLSDDTWEYQAALLAPDRAYFDRFGWSVAINGDTAVVGAVTGDGSVLNSGSVYVYTRSGTTWSFQQELTASDAVPNDFFGEKLAIEGDTIVVGSVRNNSYTGAAYVFERANGVWSETTKLTASDAVTGQQFGSAIDFEGSTLVIGAYRDSDIFSQSGAVYIFQKFNDHWAETQKLKSSQPATNGIFGLSVSLEGENLVIGSSAISVTAPNSGKAYLFTLDADTGIWSETQTLIPDDGNANAYFGHRVEIKNNLIVISSLRDADTAVNNGKVYTFVKQGTTWVQSQKFISPDAADDDYFGKSFAVSEGALLVSAHYDDEGGNNTGSLYYFGPQAPAITVNDAVITEGDNDSRFISLEVTRTAANVGDLLLPATVDFTTIDGTATAAGGDYQASSGTLTFNGDPTVLTQTKIITVEIFGDTLVELDEAFSITLSSLTGYGRIVEGTADIMIENDDQATLSINDVIVNEAAGKARLTVVLDAPVSTTVTLEYTTIDQSATTTDDYLSQTGTLTFNPGELSQIIEIDLVDSVPVELAESFDIQFSNLQAGGLDVFLPDNLATVTIMDDDIGDYELKSKLYSIGSRHADDQFGFSLAVDGDTLISSSTGWDDTYTDQGAAFIYVRNDQGTPEYTGDDSWEYQATLLAPDADNDTSDRFGHTVAISGDTAVVGALYGDEIAENAGSVFVFTRSNGVWTFQQELHVADTIGNGFFGEVVAIENDKIVVGARSTDVYAGSAYVFKRENNIWTQTAKLEADDAAPTANFGSSVDIENSTIVIGARLDSETEYWSGAVYIFKEQDGNWTQTQKLKDPTPADRGTFGTSVSLEGDLLLVGAISIPGQPESAGKAILYQLDPDSGLWNPIQTLTASDAAADSLFGVSVKIHEHQIFISSSNDPTGVNYNSAVYLFQQENQVWVEQQKFSDPAPNNGINFGRNLAVSNDTIFVAAKWENDYAPNAGSIYVYGLPQNPTITIQDVSVTEADDGSHLVTLNVTRTATKPGDLVYGATVDFRTVDGLATIAGSDYENTTGTITFAGDPIAASQTQTISIRVYGDLLVEADETFGIELLNVTGHAQISDAEATVTIQDDDQATISINDITVNEDAGTATLTVSLDQPVDLTISVEYATADQTAVSHDDYTANSGILTFNPGVQSQTITVSIINMDLVELDEKLLVNLSDLRADGREVSLSDTQGEITIQDDDQAGFYINDFTVDENAGVALVVITLDKPIDTAIDVTYSTTDINATEGLDYQYASGSVTFNPGELSKTVSVTIIDSALVEADERFAFSIGVLENHGRDININAGYAEITIHDDDQARFSINDTSVNEDAGTATLTVTLDEEVAGTLQVDYYTTSLSATSPSDFQSTSGTLTFNQGVSTQTITISIIDSELVELDESFLVSLTNIQSAFNVIFADSQGQVTIQDDDQAAITIDDVTVDEDAGTATLTVSLDQPVDTTISVDFNTADQSAIASDDYTGTAGTLTFNPEEQSKTITIPIIDSDLVEISETILVNLSSLDAAGRNVILSDNQGTITITDDDQAGISIDDISVDENAGIASVTVALDKPVDTTISVDYATFDQTAIQSDDYLSTAGTLTFNPGEQSQTILVSIVNSELVEGNESFFVNLSGILPNGRNVVFTKNQALVTIHDDDQATISINNTIVDEDAGTATLTVSLEQPAATTVTVNYATASQTAISPDDFQATSGTLTFNPGNLSKTITVSISNSNLVELDETLLVNLSDIQAGTADVIFADSQGQITIQDDDQATITINDVFIDEDAGTATIAVSLDGQVDTAISVAYHTTDQSASASVDYQAASGTLTFSPEEQSKMITISLINDEIVELDETFLVNFSNLQVSGRNVILPDTQAQVTIQNDDQASLSIDDIQVNEIQSTVTLTVSLDKEVDTTISVDYATADQTAINPEDYQFRAGTLSFNPGQLSRTITVPLVYSGLLEPEESFLVNLTNLQHQGRNVSITDAQAEVTIIDHPPNSVFSISGDQLFREGDSGTRNVRFEITRTGAVAGDLNFASSVSFTTADGTATADEDYTSKTYTFNFSASPTATVQTAATLVSVNGDTLKEFSETILGRLTNPTGGSTLAGDVEVLDGTTVLINEDSDFIFNQDFLTPPEYSNHTRDRLGDDAIAIDGDVMVVGSPLNSASGEDAGAAYIYIRNDQGTPADQSDDTWEYQTSLMPDMSQLSNYSVGARFGTSVAIDGDTIVIGARQASLNVYHTGAVFVYTRVGSDWKTQPPEMEILTTPLNTNAVYFGDAVSIYENTIVVGVPGDSSGASSGGVAYIYEKTGSSWSTADVRKLIPSDPAANTDFGVAVSIYDDLLVVGDSRNAAHGSNSGAVYIYTRSGDSWIDTAPAETKLTASDAGSNSYFGGSVSTNGSEIVVGSHQAQEHGTGTGAAYLYSRNGADWSTLPPDEIKLTGTAAYDYFGTSVSLSDQRLVVGAPGAGDAGSIFIYTKEGATWDTGTMTETVETINSTESLSYGDTVAISGGTIAVGVPGISRDGIESGALFVYQASALDTWTLASELSPTDLQSAHNVGDFFGTSIVTTDQYMLISAPRSDSPLSPEGAVFLYTRNDAGTPADQNDDFWEYTTAFTAPDPEQTRLFGETFAIAGNTILINAILDNSTAEVYIYEMNGTDWTTTAPTVTPLLSRLSRTIPQDSITANTALVIQGDTIAVSGTLATGNTGFSGAVYVYTRNGSDWSTSLPSETVLFASDGSANDHFGYAIDLDDNKLIVGAEGKQNRGGAYLYERGVTGWDSATETILNASDTLTGDRYGSVVAIDGNTVAISAPYHSGANDKSGAVYLFDGSAGWNNPTEIKLTQSDQNSFYRFGSSLALDGNLLAVGSPKNAVFLFDGSNGWDLYQETMLTYPDSSDLLGHGFGSTIALHNNNLVVAALTNEYTNRGNVFSFNRQTPAFSIDSAFITENDSGTQTLELTVTASGIIPGLYADPISIDLATVSGSALAGSDYLAFSDTIVFDNNAATSTQTKTISIEIIGDTDVEAEESFSVVLSNPSIEANLVQDTGVVTILDNDIATMNISNIEANEDDGSAVLTVTLDKPVQTTITMDYATAPQTAGAIDDFISTAGTLTFNPGEQSKIITVLLVDTGLVEVDEDFLVNLSGIQSHGHQVVFSANQAQVTIRDDDQAAISIDDTTVDEDAGTVTLTVSLDQPVDTTISVDYATSNQTAGSPDDYQSTSGTLTFNPGEQSKIFTIPIIDSSLVELDETFLVTLSALEAGDRNVIFADNQAQVTILDYDQAAISIDDTTVDEAAGTVTLTVSLDQPVDTAITLEYATTDQTAENPDDYTATSGTITFNPGEQLKTISIPIIDSNLIENNESFLVNLSGVQNHGRDVILDDSQAQVTVNDDDHVTAEINLRVVGSPSNTSGNDELVTLPTGRDWVGEWSTYWVEFWIDAQNPANQGILSTGLDFSYQTQYTSATEIEYGAAFTQNRSGLIDDATGTIENLYAETDASHLGASSYLLFARIKFEPLSEDQVLLDLNGKSIGPYDLGFEISSPQVILEETIPLDTVAGAYAGTEIWANPYDLNDDDQINYRDLILFVGVYNVRPSESDSDYAWFADLDKNDRVNYRDLISFVSNYGKSKLNQDVISYPANFPEAANDLLTVDTQYIAQPGAQPLQQTTVESMLHSAVEQVNPQLSAADSQKLETINIQVTDLKGDSLGRAAGNTIYIDSDAAGYGWFIDTTPATSEEFTESVDLTLIALPESSAAGRVDLLTVILHELGHLLGYDHEESGLMQESLVPGVRKLPAWENDADQFFTDLTDDLSIIL